MYHAVDLRDADYYYTLLPSLHIAIYIRIAAYSNLEFNCGSPKYPHIRGDLAQ